MPGEPPLSTLLAGAALGGLLVGVLKTSIGGGIGMVVTPLLTLFLPPRTVLALTAVQLNLANPISLRYYWRQWDSRQVGLLLPAVLVGIVGGGIGLSLVSDATLRRAIGAVALAGALVQAAALVRGRRDPPAPHDRPGPPGARPRGHGRVLPSLAVGLASGVASVVAHSGGLLVGPYLAGLGLSGAAIIGTGTAVVAITDVVKVLTYARIGFLGWRVAGAALAAVPALAAGAWLGYRLNRRLSRLALALALIAIAVAGSIRLLLA